MARFDDRTARPHRGFRDILRWNWDRARGKVPSDPAPRAGAPLRPNDGVLLRSPAPSLTWVGHASFVVRLGGKLVLIDPVWSSKLGGALRRHVAPGLSLDALPPVDLVLISHNHRDHLDLQTLRRLPGAPTCLAPLGNGAVLRKAGLPNVVELDWWQHHREGALEVHLVPSQHWSMRFPWDRNDALWGGFVLKAGEGSLYHAGDTGLFDGFREIGERTGPLDWALLPIGAYEPRWLMQPQHLDPSEAVEAFVQLGAKTFVAMHWGTFRLSDEPMLEPPRRLEAAWQARGLPPERLWVPDIGETRLLSRRES